VGVVLVWGHHADFARADDAVADHLGSVLAADVGHSLGVNRPGAFALLQQGQQVADGGDGQHDLNDGRKVVVGGHAGSLTDAACGVNPYLQIYLQTDNKYYQQGRTPETSRGAGPALVGLSALLGLGRLGLGCRSLEALQNAEAVASKRAADASESGSSNQSESFHLMPFD